MVTTVNNLLLPMMGKPDAKTKDPRRCVICGRYAGTGVRIEDHHVVRRGAGEAYDEEGNRLSKPVWSVCGLGNMLKDSNGIPLCHGLIHHGYIHPRWSFDHWEYLRTEEPMKYQDALEMEGWKEIYDM